MFAPVTYTKECMHILLSWSVKKPRIMYFIWSCNLLRFTPFILPYLFSFSLFWVKLLDHIPAIFWQVNSAHTRKCWLTFMGSDELLSQFPEFKDWEHRDCLFFIYLLVRVRFPMKLPSLSRLCSELNRMKKRARSRLRLGLQPAKHHVVMIKSAK